MFGTLEIPTEKNPRLTYGVDEPGVDPHSAFGMLATPAVKSATALWNALASGLKSLTGALATASARQP